VLTEKIAREDSEIAAIKGVQADHDERIRKLETGR
jgi:hypothetical protein